MRVRLDSILLVFAAAVAGGMAAGAWALSQEDQYRATAVAAIGPSSSLETDADVIDVVGALDRTGIAATAAGVAESRSVRDLAADAMGVTPRQLVDYDIEGVPVLGANLVDVVVSGPDPDTAAALANSVVELIQGHIADFYQVYELDVVTLATAPDHSTRPPVVIVVTAGAAASAAAAALFLYATDAGRRVRRRVEKVAV